MEATIAEKDYDGIWREMTAKFWQRKPLCSDLETQIQQRLGRIKATVLYHTASSRPLAIEVSSHDGLMRGAAIVADGDHFEWQTGFRKAGKRLLRIMMVAGVEADFHWRPRLYHDLLATDRNVIEYLRQRFPALEGVHIDTVLERERARREEKRKRMAEEAAAAVAATEKQSEPIPLGQTRHHLRCDRCGDWSTLHSPRGEELPAGLSFPCRIRGCDGTRRVNGDWSSGKLKLSRGVVIDKGVSVEVEAQHGTAEQS